MKNSGIIAEYNPFHLGHKYQIDRIKNELNSNIIAIMSGDFVQRGECSILDKYTRARIAVNNGVDLVIELPFYYSLQSAENFAKGGISILNKLDIIDYLCFGFECEKKEDIIEIAKFQLQYKNEIEKIMKVCSKNHQTLCFSATMDSQVKKLAYRYMKEPVFIDIQSPTIAVDKIKQEVVEVSDRWKQEALCSTLNEDNPFMAIIFCRTKRRADALELALHQKGYNCQKIHSDVPQPKRERIIKAFRNADIQYLIATDVAARGIDISGVTHIYNYDTPETPESYIHRIGRTGRAGEDGYTCMFVAPKDENQLKEIEEKIGFKINRREIKR